MDNIIPSFNILIILLAAAAYWLLGALWYSMITGNVWSNELTKHGVTLPEPTRQQLVRKLFLSFILNVIIAFGVAVILWFIGSAGMDEGIILGLIIGLSFSAATIGLTYSWENRSFKLFLVDAGYHVIGITLCAVILSMWM